MPAYGVNYLKVVHLFKHSWLLKIWGMAEKLVKQAMFLSSFKTYISNISFNSVKHYRLVGVHTQNLAFIFIDFATIKQC